MLRNTSGVNLSVAGVSEESTMTIHLHSSRTVRCHCVGREEEGVAITTGADYYSMSEEALDASGNEVTCDDTASALLTILVFNHHEIEHLIAGVHFYFALTNLARKSRVSTQEKLLTGLTLSVECAAYLCATKRTVVKQTTIFASERNTLCYTLVDDAVAHLCQAINVCFTSAIVTALDGIVIQAIDRVTIILIILSCIDTALCCNRVCTTR